MYRLEWRFRCFNIGIGPCRIEHVLQSASKMDHQLGVSIRSGSESLLQAPGQPGTVCGLQSWFAQKVGNELAWRRDRWALGSRESAHQGLDSLLEPLLYLRNVGAGRFECLQPIKRRNGEPQEGVAVKRLQASALIASDPLPGALTMASNSLMNATSTGIASCVPVGSGVSLTSVRSSATCSTVS